MARTPGSAAGFAPQRSTADDHALLDAIRRALVPGDPVARLLATWPRTVATPVRPPEQRGAAD